MYGNSIRPFVRTEGEDEAMPGLMQVALDYDIGAYLARLKSGPDVVVNDCVLVKVKTEK